MFKRSFLATWGTLYIVAALVLAQQGCSDDETTPTAASSTTTTTTTTTGPGGGGGGGSSTMGSVTGTVSYEGTQTGPALYIAILESFPPMGPPVAFERVADPMFPQAFEVGNIAPGDYQAFAYLAVGEDHFMGPQGTDPISAPVPITVTAGAATMADLTLNDPGTGGSGGGGGAGGAGGN